METKIGRIFSFDAERKFGFIQEIESGERHFCHLMDFDGNPVPAIGTPVAFTIGKYRGREKATHIRPLTPQEILGGVA
jgi:cold shock CspA family protein